MTNSRKHNEKAASNGKRARGTEGCEGTAAANSFCALPATLASRMATLLPTLRSQPAATQHQRGKGWPSTHIGS
eukprot:12724224-Alexandrium_andersonii.AAC.1